jgi:hypothetical protein
LAKKSECREKRLSGNQILHRDVPEFLHVPPVFPENLVNPIPKKFYIILFGNYWLCEIRFNESHTFLKSAKIFFCSLYIFIRVGKKINMKMVITIYWMVVRFVKIDTVKLILHCEASMNFYWYYPQLHPLFDFRENLYKKLA